MVDLPYKIEGFNPMDEPPLVAVIPKKGNSKKKPYLSEAIYLDTETSKILNKDTSEAVGWIYQWAFRFAGKDCIGRYPTELIEDLKRAVMPSIEAAGGNARCIVFVHNLSYDIQYLKAWLFDAFGDEDYEILAVAPHKFITFTIGPFEFRCTYKLSNRSLAKWGKDLGIKARKKSGMIDYSKIRYQDSELSLDDWIYMLYDIWALEECVNKQMAIYGDDLQHLPLTSTGYVRREARRNYRKDLKKNIPEFRRTRMSVDVYRALCRAGAGGISHGNRLFEDFRVDVDSVYTGPPRSESILSIRHVDYRSHYPTQQRASDEMYGFPLDKFAHYWAYRKEGDLFTFDMLDKVSRRNCTLVELYLYNVTLKEHITLPYLMHYKCFEGRCSDFGEPYWDEEHDRMIPGKDIQDNGRVLQFTGACCIVCTEWDLKWIRKQYDFKCKIINVWTSPRGKCPQYLCDTVDEFFTTKDVLKTRVKMLKDKLEALKESNASAAAIANAEVELIDAAIDLMKAKNGLNGIFGMCYTDPVRVEYQMDPESGDWDVKEEKSDKMIARQLYGWDDAEGVHHKGYYENYNNFMVYAFGVYVTALARNELLEAVEAIGYKYFLYCDTDSIFFIETPHTMERLEVINKWRNIRAEKIGAYIITPDGKKVYYDVLEDEHENITSFKYIHAKAYAYITDGGTKKEELHCTIAGVSEFSPDYDPKANKGTTRVQELGSIDDLTNGKVFEKTGGTTCTYIERPLTLLNINGHVTQLASAAILQDTTKKLNGPIAKDEVWYIWNNTEEIT